MSRNKRPRAVTARVVHRPAAYRGCAGELIWINQGRQGHHRRNHALRISRNPVKASPYKEFPPARAGAPGAVTSTD